LARYIPRPTGEQLATEQVNFIDLAGNMNLVLADKYSRTILGRPQEKTGAADTPMTAGQLQILFLFAAVPDAVRWPVRKIAAQAGVSKSKAAQVRQQLLEKRAGDAHPETQGWLDRQRLETLLTSGYEQVLRPKLLLGRFRVPETKPEDFLARLARDLVTTGVRASLTGGPAADLLQHFYRGPETPLFFTEWTPDIQRKLRMLPDRTGPVMILRAFGEPVFWRKVGDLTVSHPWLIYVELLHSEDPRAHEAAEELRKKFLQS
jgi:hypothetical protein